MPDPTKSNETGDSLFGIAGLALVIVFFLGIVVAPGRFESVMVGGILGVAGLILSIIGIAASRGRIPVMVGVALFVLGWVVNTVITGRL